jgi:hypothetical protein
MARKLEENDIITIAVEGFFLILYGTIEREREREREGVGCCCAIQREVVAGL